MYVEIVEVGEQTESYRDLFAVAIQLDQSRYIPANETHIEDSILLGAFIGNRCVGFLRLLIQIIGNDEGRPPITHAGEPLREGYVMAFAVVPQYRRQGIGQRLQEQAITLCHQRGCYQIRSRSPITSRENYALKLKMGYAIHPSAENDSYYFIKTLTSM
jgi:GNAT superfamily N-acetyltransferase